MNKKHHNLPAWRLSRGRCPVHGIPMGQLDHNDYYPIIGCPRPQCPESAMVEDGIYKRIPLTNETDPPDAPALDFLSCK